MLYNITLFQQTGREGRADLHFAQADDSEGNKKGPP